MPNRIFLTVIQYRTCLLFCNTEFTKGELRSTTVYEGCSTGVTTVRNGHGRIANSTVSVHGHGLAITLLFGRNYQTMSQVTLPKIISQLMIGMVSKASIGHKDHLRILRYGPYDMGHMIWDTAVIYLRNRD